MKPTKVGQVAKFHTPNEDEDPNQLYVVLEIKGEDDSARVDIKAVNRRRDKCLGYGERRERQRTQRNFVCKLNFYAKN